MSSLPQPRRQRRGAAALEFALVFPLLLTMTFGIVEFGWMFHQYNEVHTAIRDAARYAAKGGQSDHAGAEQAAEDAAHDNLIFYGINTMSETNCLADASVNNSDETITILARLSYAPITGFAVPGIPATLDAEITFALEP